ncbi:hypothetical protein QQF64_004124, partial [Cirrhinus molitorella]
MCIFTQEETPDSVALVHASPAQQQWRAPGRGSPFSSSAPGERRSVGGCTETVKGCVSPRKAMEGNLEPPDVKMVFGGTLRRGPGSQAFNTDHPPGWGEINATLEQLKGRRRRSSREPAEREDVQQLRETVESHKRSAQTAVEDSERIFTELIRSIERSRSELIRLIRDQEKAAVSRAEGRLERLEQEINDLRRRDAELEQLSHTQDHIQFLQKQLKETQKTFQQRIQQREKDVQQLREAVKSHKRSAQTAVEDSERIFTELIRSIERSRSELIRLIRDQEKAAVSRAEGRLERLEQEINDLRRRDAELEQLSHTQDHIQFLQSFQSLSAPPESTDVNEDLFSSLFSFDVLRESVHQLRDKLEDFCKEELKKISDRVTFTNIVPRTRKDFLQYSHQLTLDLNTVNKRLHLTENNRVITNNNTVQSYPDHPDRFDHWPQVLCRESVCGCCYWELEWSTVISSVFISVSYKSISRKGSGVECVFGSNDQSWSLICYPSRYSFRHNNIETALPVKSISSRIGVYVDHSAGTLSFYSVSDTMSLIHTEHTTFTQPLYPGFYSFQSLSAPPESTGVNEDLFSSFFSFDGLTESVHHLRDKLEDFCKEELKKISDSVTFTNIVPRTRKDFLQYSHQLTLDLNTVNKRLHLTENNRVITNNNTVQSYPDHPDRFDVWQQVLCRESVCGRCYWELEWSAGKNGFVFISVSYKSISEK